ncbi:MAG: HEAT repeat domain-containing protein [Elusimicrobiota bacterium]
MRYKIFLIILFLITCLSGGSLYAKNDTAQLYFNRALESYLKGDLDGSINNAEEAIKFDKENKKMQVFLIKVLVERGSGFFLDKQYSDALPYLEKAKWLDPDNEEVNKMYGMVYNKLNPPAVKEPALKNTQAESQPVRTVSAPPANDIQMANAMTSLLLAFQKQQEKLIEAYTYPQDILRQVMSDSDKERKYLLQTLERSLAQERQASSRRFIFTITGFAVFFLAIIALVYFIVMKASVRRENILVEQQARILNIVQQQGQALSQGKTQLKLTHTPMDTKNTTPREMLNDPNPRIRSKGLEVIEAELVEEDEDAAVAERLLEPFIKEKDNRVKSTAIKIMHRYNPEKAMQNIHEMINSDDKWMRISAAWVLGEITPDAEVIDTLLSKTDDSDYHFRRRVVKALKNIISSDKNKLTKKQKSMIEKTLEDLAYEKKWVV